MSTEFVFILKMLAITLRSRQTKSEQSYSQISNDDRVSFVKYLFKTCRYLMDKHNTANDENGIAAEVTKVLIHVISGPPSCPAFDKMASIRNVSKIMKSPREVIRITLPCF